MKSFVVAVGCAAALAVTGVVPASAAVRSIEGEVVTPLQPAGADVVPQGIKRGDTKGSFYVVGTKDATTGAVYTGPITPGAQTGAVGAWTFMNVPAAWATSSAAVTTSIYGVENLPGQRVALVGTWAEGDLLGEGNASFYYEGPVTATPDADNFRQFTATNRSGTPAQFTFLHSVSGGLVVGNWDMAGDNNPAGNAFIYDSQSGAQVPIKYPKRERVYTHTAYGIWYNGGHSYTIAGGASKDKRFKSGRILEPLGDGTLIDYNAKSGRFSNFTRFSFPEQGGKAKRSPITHFEGIWSNGTGKYRMPATVIAKSGKGETAAIMTVRRQGNGSYGMGRWATPDLGTELIATNNSLYNKVSVGIGDFGDGVQSYGFRAE